MTILLELECSKGLRAHPIKDQWIMSGNSRILHVLSEDVITANVFGVLKNLDPKVWFVSFLQNACHFSREQFPSLYELENYSTFSLSLWQDLDNPPPRLEGPTQADVVIELKKATFMIECKGLAALQKRVSTDEPNADPKCWWDQAIRGIVRGYAYSKKRFNKKVFFFIVLSMSEKEKTFKQYENWRRIKEQVERRITKDPKLGDAFPKDSVDSICQKLSRQIRWVKWVDLKEALEKSLFNEEGEFKPQNKFCKDVIEYLELKSRLSKRSVSKQN